MMIAMTLELANAIIDMDNIGWSESLGPETDESNQAWFDLVEAAEVVANRQAVGHKEEEEHDSAY